jgi:polysaccharide export outer membrane protein
MKKGNPMRRNGKNKSRSVFPSFFYCTGIFLLFFGFLPMRILALQEGQKLPVNDYRIGTKDLLEIRVFELPELNQTVRVAEDGSVSLSLIGKVEVAGLTSQELEKKLASILDQRYTKGAHVTVFIKEYQKVAVLGAIARPGNYELVGPATILQIISQAGGLTPEAMKEIYVFRRGPDGQKTRIAINLDDLTIKGDQNLNIDLQPNDVVSIPVDRVLTVYVYGEVRSPGGIQFRQSQKFTLLQAIAKAGGPTEWASTSRVTIKRKPEGTGKEIKIFVNLKNVISGKISDITLEDGDVIIIP